MEWLRPFGRGTTLRGHNNHGYQPLTSPGMILQVRLRLLRSPKKKYPTNLNWDDSPRNLGKSWSWNHREGVQNMASFSDSDHLSSEEEDREEMDVLMTWQLDVDVVGLGFFTDPIPWYIETIEKPPPFLGRMCFLVFTLSQASNGQANPSLPGFFPPS